MPSVEPSSTSTSVAPARLASSVSPSGSRRSASSKHGTTMATLIDPRSRPLVIRRSLLDVHGRLGRNECGEIGHERGTVLALALARSLSCSRRPTAHVERPGTGRPRRESPAVAAASASRTAVSAVVSAGPGRPRADPSRVVVTTGPLGEHAHRPRRQQRRGDRAPVDQLEVPGEQGAELGRPVPPVVLEHAVVVREERRVRGHADDCGPARRHQRHHLSGQEALVVLDVLQDVQQEDEVEGPVRASLGPRDARSGRRRQVLRAVVDVPADDLGGGAEVGQQLLREPAVAGPDVEHAADRAHLDRTGDQPAKNRARASSQGWRPAGPPGRHRREENQGRRARSIGPLAEVHQAAFGSSSDGGGARNTAMGWPRSIRAVRSRWSAADSLGRPTCRTGWCRRGARGRQRPRPSADR